MITILSASKKGPDYLVGFQITTQTAKVFDSWGMLSGTIATGLTIDQIIDQVYIMQKPHIDAEIYRLDNIDPLDITADVIGMEYIPSIPVPSRVDISGSRVITQMNTDEQVTSYSAIVYDQYNSPITVPIQWSSDAGKLVDNNLYTTEPGMIKICVATTDGSNISSEYSVSIIPYVEIVPPAPTSSMSEIVAALSTRVDSIEKDTLTATSAIADMYELVNTEG